MNILAKKEALEIIKELGDIRVNDKVVYYQFTSGVDYRFITQEIANALKKSRFNKIRIAWDWGFNQQYKIREAIKLLLKAGYNPNKIMLFIICNWKISHSENCKKLDLCKVWNVQVADCYFDNQVSPNIEPIHWKDEEIKDFRRRCRKHNQLVNFKIDPEVKQ